MTSVLDEINPQGVELVPFTRETLAPIAALGEAGVLTATSLDLSKEIDYDTYEALGTALGAFDRACRWWVGDWLLYGEKAYDADRYAEAARHLGLSEGTLMNRISVSRSIPPSRRRHLVGYSCHVLVAPLPARQQTKWLKHAEEHGSTVTELRAAIKGAVGMAPVDTHDVVASEPIVDLLITAAHSLLDHAQEAGENVICRREDVARLRAALGEER